MAGPVSLHGYWARQPLTGKIGVAAEGAVALSVSAAVEAAALAEAAAEPAEALSEAAAGAVHAISNVYGKIRGVNHVKKSVDNTTLKK